MRLHVLSDLHLEFDAFVPKPVKADVVILAGDTDRGTRGIQWARQHFLDRPVLYLAGNHEYYKHKLPRLDEKLADAARGTDVTFMQQTSVTFGGVRFLGCTLWTDQNLLGNIPLATSALLQGMNDYQAIRVDPSYRKLNPADTRAIHSRHLAWLERELEASTEPTVVITHHAPTARSLGPNWSNDPLSTGYASNLEDVILDRGPMLWIHGHTHRVVDHEIGTTRVVSNCRGYSPDMVAAGFDPIRILDL